ncbi:PAAR-like protein [Piscirickettsia litoralis]|uniref:DUF4280 domain-containing protein n=1 Tax=Piscirickettsia litoralis TaxID=1891921 RepID=A0ABX3A1V7_9GAMM|nr:PAAR-like protein [Piscirickettsia litoralis]ODN41646.1 hypothetical protein BGC07_16260 [Piscirickettsia litoralis]
MDALDQLKNMLPGLLGVGFLPDILGLYHDALAGLSVLNDYYNKAKNFAMDQYSDALETLNWLTNKALSGYQYIINKAKGYFSVPSFFSLKDLCAYFYPLDQIINDINEAIACLTSSFSSFSAGAEADQIGVASGARIKCDKGLAEMPINIIPLGKNYAPGKAMTVMLNVIPYLNIPSFGACMSSSNPLATANFGILPTTCIPIVTPFFPPATLTKAVSLPVATSQSQCYCIFSMMSATLTIADPGQDEMKVT